MSGHSERPGPDEYIPYFGVYIGRVPDGDIAAQLESQLEGTLSLLAPLSDADGEHRYGEDKWTIKEVVGHIMDTERVFAYRALRIARGDGTPLPGFESDEYVPTGEFGGRTLESLLDELAAVRNATAALFSSLPTAAWTRRGKVSGAPATVRSLAYVIAGHELHHRDILAERYLGLKESTG